MTTAQAQRSPDHRDDAPRLPWQLWMWAAALLLGSTPALFGASLGERIVISGTLSLISLLFSGWLVVPILALVLTDALATLSAEELVAVGSRSLDLAQGLGDEVVVIGISGGGNVAAWLAQQRADIAQAMLIAPMFHVEGLPPFAIRPAASTILAVPNFYMWWDDQRREQALGPPYAYPRYPVHAITATNSGTESLSFRELMLHYSFDQLAYEGRPRSGRLGVGARPSELRPPVRRVASGSIEACRATFRVCFRHPGPARYTARSGT